MDHLTQRKKSETGKILPPGGRVRDGGWKMQYFTCMGERIKVIRYK